MPHRSTALYARHINSDQKNLFSRCCGCGYFLISQIRLEVFMIIMSGLRGSCGETMMKENIV
jgi:hypothetical protein